MTTLWLSSVQAESVARTASILSTWRPFLDQSASSPPAIRRWDYARSQAETAAGNSMPLLREKRLLLAAAEIWALPLNMTSLNVVVTSRASLRVDGEHVLPVSAALPGRTNRSLWSASWQ